jgi:hypothetical protein
MEMMYAGSSRISLNGARWIVSSLSSNKSSNFRNWMPVQTTHPDFPPLRILGLMNSPFDSGVGATLARRHIHTLTLRTDTSSSHRHRESPRAVRPVPGSDICTRCPRCLRRKTIDPCISRVPNRCSLLLGKRIGQDAWGTPCPCYR